MRGYMEVVDSVTTAWMLVSTGLVLLMIPGLAMFYGGLVHTKNVLGTMMHSFVPLAVIGVLWVAVGYSLSFGKNALGGFIGWNPDYFFLNGIDESIVNGVPEYVIAMFQGKFAIITPALISGAIAERVSIKGYILFIALWFLAIYCPLAHWIWASDGWLFTSGPGVIDLAGGLVIHVSAASGALTWMIVESIKFRKVTSLGFVSGILAGLVVITPAAGVVTPKGAILLGMASSIICFFALEMKNKLGYDDSLDCFGIHGVGSGFGVLALSFLIRDSWMKQAAAKMGGEWTYFQQFLLQLKGMGVTILLSAVGTLIICFIVQKTVGFRISKSEELAGLDHTEHSESGYGLMNLN